jgi:hypothetical protein
VGGAAEGVAELQTGLEKRGWNLLILNGGFAEAPPTRVFCKKSLDLLDCKGVEFFESDKELATV